MEVYPWAEAFFVPFIAVATFTILNLFIGIIVSTMQELSTLPDPKAKHADLKETLTRMEGDLAKLRRHLNQDLQTQSASVLKIPSSLLLSISG
jgi:voltage-gated sodium channel